MKTQVNKKKLNKEYLLNKCSTQWWIRFTTTALPEATNHVLCIRNLRTKKTVAATALLQQYIGLKKKRFAVSAQHVSVRAVALAELMRF